MQQKNFSIFQNLHDLLKDFRTSYLQDHKNLLSEERSCLDTLSFVIEELQVLLKQGAAINFTLTKYKFYILRLESVIPPANITEMRKTEGIFLGIGSTTVATKVPVPLNPPMTSLINDLKKTLARLEVEEAQEESDKKKQSLEVNKEKPSSDMELFKTELKDLKQRMTASERRADEAYERGRQDAQQQMISYFKANIFKFIEPSQHQNALLALENVKSSASPSSSDSFPSSSSFSNVFSSPAPTKASVSDTPIVTNENAQKEEARKQIGDAKFAVIERLVGVHNILSSLKPEKFIAKWAIFELMLHKYDRTISSVLADVKNTLSTKCNLDLTQFPALNKIFQDNAEKYDEVTTQKLSADELHAFAKLVDSRIATYLPADNTASSCFESKSLIMKGQNAKETTENDYIDNVIGKLPKPSPTPTHT